MAWQHPSVYPRGRSCIIVGAAPSVLRELELARALYPTADLIAVKFAVALVRCHEAVTSHLDTAHLIRGVHHAVWRTPLVIHGKPTIDERDPPDTGCDVLWESLRQQQGSSGWAAAMIAKRLGYRNVVLAGVHIGGDHADETMYHPAIAEVVEAIMPGWHEIRVRSVTSPSNLLRWQAAIREDVRRGRANGVTSFGGFTRDILGEPGYQKHSNMEAAHGRH